MIPKGIPIFNNEPVFSGNYKYEVLLQQYYINPDTNKKVIDGTIRIIVMSDNEYNAFLNAIAKQEYYIKNNQRKYLLQSQLIDEAGKVFPIKKFISNTVPAKKYEILSIRRIK